MLRTFVNHKKRQVEDLSGLWDFQIIDSRDALPENYEDQMVVPICYDAMPSYIDYRGPAAYRTWIKTDDQRHRLVFDGVSHIAKVYLDGDLVGEHSGAFTRFTVDIPPGNAGIHELVVIVDNSFDYEASPLHHDYFDWYTYGGIIRPVALHRLSDLWIESVTARIKDWKNGNLILDIVWGREADGPPKETLRVAIDGETIHEQQLQLRSTEGQLQVDAVVPEPEPWTPENPHLHIIEVRLGNDDLIERIGLREIEVSGTEVLLNGEPVFLAGVNRHEAHPEFGHSVPLGIMLADIQWLQEMNCNFVRGSHYPQDVRFLDLCDEHGILVWQEATAWQAKVEHLTDPHFVQAQLECIDEMVAQSINHPSVIMWGILNESASDEPESRPAYEQFLGRLRDLDPSRPVTYASHRHLGDLFFDLVDIISLNIYPGWYFADLETMEGWMNDLMGGMAEQGWGDKPVIFSEFGAGAIYGWHDARNGKWSEPYQAQLLDIALNWMLEHPQVVGTAIWQYCDCLVSPTRAVGRPRGFNNKGLLDEYRRPKQAFEVVKEIYRKTT